MAKCPLPAQTCTHSNKSSNAYCEGCCFLVHVQKVLNNSTCDAKTAAFLGFCFSVLIALGSPVCYWSSHFSSPTPTSATELQQLNSEQEGRAQLARG
eukprot:5249968-Amphidinium_carterae.1